MNKLFTKIATAFVGIAMAIGVGVAVGSKSVVPAKAADSTYAFTSKSWGDSTSSWTTDKDGNQLTSGRGVQITTGVSGAGAHSKSSISNITDIEFTYSTNGSAGAGSISVTIGTNAAVTYSVTKTGGTTDRTTSHNYSTAQSGVVTFTVTCSTNSIYVKSVKITTSSGGTPATYTGVTVSEKTALTGTYKGDAYYECQATVTGTGSFSSAVTWSITSSSTYGNGTSVANKASIDSNGKITFLDNCTIYAWATAANGTTHNTTGFSVTASGLLDNPISSWTKITDVDNVSLKKVYALSNNGTLFASNSVSSNYIPLTSSLSSIGYVALESTEGGYYVRFATQTAGVWSASGNYIKWANDSTKLSSAESPDSTHGKWNIVENGSNGVYLKNSGSDRHLGLNGSTDIRAYASGNLSGNAPVYLYEAGSLPVVPCDLIELTGKPTSDMSIGDTATLGYTALDADANEWTGDVVYSISNEKDVDNNTTTGVVELSATSGASVTLTAKKAGTARVTVQDADANAEADYVDVTVLPDPERLDLPVGSYVVVIDAADETSSTVPATRDYEIIAKDGRTWYRNLSVSFTDISVDTSHKEYVSAESTGSLGITNNSNAIISSVEIHYYKYINEGVGVYIGENMLEPTSSTGTSGTDNDLYRGYTNITGNSFALKNKNDNYTSKYYKITINLTVVDESEEFWSLVVSKSEGWTTAANGTYKVGQSPTSSGLVVTANYSNNGTSITRSEDVTALVSNWAFTPSTLAVSDTSFTATATWDTHTSDAFVVNNIVVENITGPIASGRYYIMNSDKTLGMSAIAYTGSHPVAIDLTKDNDLIAFDVTLVDDNEYEITTTISSTKYYLVNNSVATSKNNDNIRITNSPISGLAHKTWSLTETEDGYHVSQNTTGSTLRYLSCYDSADWRGYLNTDNGDPIINFVEEGLYASQIAETIMSNESPLCNGGSTAPNVSAWNAIASITHIENELAILRGTTAAAKNAQGETPIGTTAEKAMARYDEIMVRYNTQSSSTYVDFLGRVEAQGLILRSSNALIGVNDANGSTTTIIVVISMLSLISVSGFFFLRRRKEQ